MLNAAANRTIISSGPAQNADEEQSCRGDFIFAFLPLREERKALAASTLYGNVIPNFTSY
jgi:hypothetical protein